LDGPGRKRERAMQHLVPLAEDDAGQGPATDRPASAGACPHTRAPCPAMQKLLGHAAEAGGVSATDWVTRITPCGSCRIAFEAKRAALRGRRLGRREREVLLGAARSDAFAVTGHGMAKAKNAARRRAAQSLVRAGLVASVNVNGPSDEEPGVPAHLARATVELTPMGRYVLAAYGRYIETGKPIRWTRPAAAARLPGADPATLVAEALERVRAELHATLGELKQVLVAAVARPIRDPALLDTVTRGLHEKAQGLRDLLAAPEQEAEAPRRTA
jgi:hypothetical protein